MIIEINFNGYNYEVDLSQPQDISIPLFPNEKGVNCFFAPNSKAEPVRSGDFVGSIEEGGLLNFKNLFVNPHGNGTHTESVQHISSQGRSINKTLQKFHFVGQLITIEPEELNDNRIIFKNGLKSKVDLAEPCDALIIRTIPNSDDKLTKNYSGSNPAYFDPDAIFWLREIGVRHLIVDLPSVDKEQDEGKLAAHKAFWNVPENPDNTRTITEMVYIPDHVKDGLYFINIQITSVEMDASLSKVVLYKLKKDSKSEQDQ